MYNRTLKRPMFRRGGDVRRQGYNGENGSGIVDKIVPTREEIEKLQGFMPQRGPDNSLNDFLINFGLDLGSRTPAGNIFQTAAQSAKEPFQQFQKSKALRSQGEREETTNMIETIMGAKAKALGSEGGSQMFSKDSASDNVERLMTELFTLSAVQDTDEALSETDYTHKEAIILKQLEVYTGKNPAVDFIFRNKDQADLVVRGIQKDVLNSEKKITVKGADGIDIEVVEGEYAYDNPSYLGKRIQEIFLDQHKSAVKKSYGIKKAEGGRIGYAGGEIVEEQITEEIQDPDQDSLTYEELRARLPEEITDDIVVILAESPSALVDFAEIQTQTDVDEFNMKYGVNLSLPSGA
jgi:hypothetical protein